jgi:hypothetical protein
MVSVAANCILVFRARLLGNDARRDKICKCIAKGIRALWCFPNHKMRLLYKEFIEATNLMSREFSRILPGILLLLHESIYVLCQYTSSLH